MPPQITVCIPTRNRPAYLRQAIVSVLEEIGIDVRIVVGDNGDAAPTRTLLTTLQVKYPTVGFVHLENPAGSTYVLNLQRVVDAVETEWLAILHDDDFFTEHPKPELRKMLGRKEVDFVFSDHWVASAEGKLLPVESDENSARYGRTQLREGRVDNLARLAVSQAICLDGFFVRRSLAQSVRFDLNYPVFSDSKWLFEVADLVGDKGLYWNQRIFAYRLSPDSLTRRTLDHLEFIQCHQGLELSDDVASEALRHRQRRLLFPAAKQAVRALSVRQLYLVASNALRLAGDRNRSTPHRS